MVCEKRRKERIQIRIEFETSRDNAEYVPLNCFARAWNSTNSMIASIIPQLLVLLRTCWLIEDKPFIIHLLIAIPYKKDAIANAIRQPLIFVTYAATMYWNVIAIKNRVGVLVPNGHLSNRNIHFKCVGSARKSMCSYFHSPHWGWQLKWIGPCVGGKINEKVIGDEWRHSTYWRCLYNNKQDNFAQFLFQSIDFAEYFSRWRKF